ncbi:MAG: patatin-like phospholipase family protein [Kineosporiaceae bacterium]
MRDDAMGVDSSSLWFEEVGAVERRFCGVFEGGGAKGVAYAGALAAMAQRRWWFDAVAGASAGAITAALVAAGLTPDQIGSKTIEALGTVPTSGWAGVRRLKRTTGFYPSGALSQWLEGLLREQTTRQPSATSSSVTFAELFAATHIELNVVATDISARAQVVFSHWSTPSCSVSDAVMASSAIPFAFPSRQLRVPGSGGVAHHTIVDGGVWSNFPIHVFEDPWFRRHYMRDPEHVPQERIIGFVLVEQEDRPPPRGDEVRFEDAGATTSLRPAEWAKPPNQDSRPGRLGWGQRLTSAALWPLAVLGTAIDLNGGPGRGRWPTPRSLVVRRIVAAVDGLLGGVYPLLFAVFGMAVVVLGAWRSASWLGRDLIRATAAADWSQAADYVLRPFIIMLGLLFLAVSVLVSFAALLGFTANTVLLGAARSVAYGVLTTYVAGPGAPPWALARPNVVSLPVPAGLTTLSFAAPESLVLEATHRAEAATRAALDGLV